MLMMNLFYRDRPLLFSWIRFFWGPADSCTYSRRLGDNTCHIVCVLTVKGLGRGVAGRVSDRFVVYESLGLFVSGGSLQFL